METTKKTISVIIAMCILIALLVSGSFVEASESYNLVIAGTTVTSENKNDILGDGVFSFDDQSSALTIHGDCATTYEVINSKLMNLTIIVEADSHLQSYSSDTIRLSADNPNSKAIITGSGHLFLDTYRSSGIYLDRCKQLVIDQAFIEITGLYGIATANSPYKELVIDESTLHIVSERNPITGFYNGITLNDSLCIRGTINSDFAYGDYLDEWHQDLEIIPYYTYPLFVGSKMVDSLNKNDILGDGHFSFDGESTLFIYGDYKGVNCAIESKIDGLIIDVKKDATLESYGTTIQLDGNTTITGSGKLIVKNSCNSPSVIRTGTIKHLTIDHANVEIIGEYGLCGWSNTGTLNIVSSAVHVESPKGSIMWFNRINLINCILNNPLDGIIIDGSICLQNGNLSTDISIGPVEPSNPFEDVLIGAYYYDPVLWAVNTRPQVTAGTSSNSFSPNSVCTRAQVVTFLWRAAGEPAPLLKTNPFTDVNTNTYYYNAVLWAIEDEITAGTSSTTFSPNSPCTRAQVVTFLWRADGKHQPGNVDCSFTDVSLGSYYEKAVLWASENRITTGTSYNTFSPDATCIRGQIVTFLYRYITN